MSHSRVLRAKMELTCSVLLDAFERLWRSPEIARVLPEFLVLLHQIMRASVPLMVAAQRRAQEAARAGDPVAAQLLDYLSAHIPEEQDHDVWILDDLAAVGLSRAAVLGRVPSPTVASLVGAQYYWVEHHHPVALLGYIAVLEGFPPNPERIAALQRRTGLPRAAFRTYLKHAALDPHHRADLDRALDALPLDHEQQGLIGLSAAHTAALLADAVLDAVEAGESEAPARRAGRARRSSGRGAA